MSKILIDLWPMMQRCFDALRDKQKQAQQQAQQQKGVGSGSGSGGVPTPGQSGSGDDEDDTDECHPGTGRACDFEESDRIAAHLTNSITSSGSGGVDQNSEYDGYDYEHAAEDIERLLEHMAEEKSHRGTRGRTL